MTGTPPPPLTREAFGAGRAHVEPHDHAVCVYEGRDDLVRAFATFLDEGLAKGELNVLVHGFDHEEEAWAFVEDARPDAKRLRQDQLVLVDLYTRSFEAGRRRIDYEHVTKVVGALVDMARSRDMGGVRIFVDASRRYFGEKRDQEWFAFEAWLGRRLQAKVGLVCAYQRADATRADLFPDMLRTHAYRFEGRRS